MNSDTANQFPLGRDCLLPNLSRFPQLTESWNRSGETLRAIRERLHDAKLPQEIETVYICGSMGRMEMLPASDCDLVVVTNDVEADSARGHELHTSVWEAIEPLGLTRPKANGIFSQVVSREKLVSRETLGLVDEDQFVFGKRIQLLLDSQPVYCAAEFESLSAEILNRYRIAHATLWNESLWSGLLAELMRYFGSLKVRTLWIPQTKPGTWRILNAKLRHSRLILIAGLMVLLNRSNAAEDVAAELSLPSLKRTPLERIALACSSSGDASLAKLLSAYESFLLSMNTPELVMRLSDETRSHPEVEQELTQLAKSADALRDSLLSLSKAHDDLAVGSLLL